MKIQSSHRRRVPNLLLALIGLLAALATPIENQALAAAAPDAGTATTGGSWMTTGSLVTARTQHTATRLTDGKVLVVGGTRFDGLGGLDRSAELYDPTTGSWLPAAPLNWTRSGHTATLLRDGRVLVAGGYTLSSNGIPVAAGTVEMYDPATGTWSITGSPSTSRQGHTAALLQDGTVLVAGGFAPEAAVGVLDSAEVYDPTRGTWRPAGRLQVARADHTMTLLPNGKVLVAGGTYDFVNHVETINAEIYDPAVGTWATVGNLLGATTHHTATLLSNGKVLVAGGNGNSFTRATAELFEPAAGSWRGTGNLNVARESHTATLLLTGEVLLAGGYIYTATPLGELGATELYDATLATWSSTGNLNVARSNHTATLLLDGRVLIAGGDVRVSRDERTSLASAEIYTPTATIDAGFSGAWFDPGQSGHGIFIQVLPDNRLLAWWFTFDPAGTEQAWFGGIGTYSGGTATIDVVEQTTGGRWIPNFDPNRIVNSAWGKLSFTFSDRNRGRVDFESVRGYGTGSMNLTRLTQPASASPIDTWIGSPGAVTTDASGNVYFSSSPNRVFKVDNRGALTRIAGSGLPGYSGDGGPALLAQLNFPLSYPELDSQPTEYNELVGGLAADSAGNLYIADAYNNRVRKIDSNGIISTVVGNGTTGYSGDGGMATNARVHWPQGVAVDSVGNLYVSTTYASLRKVTPSGLITTLAGGNCGPGYLGPGLCAPEQIAVNASGSVFVPDAYCRVREVRQDGSVVTVAGNDRRPSGSGSAFTCGYSGDGGAATNAALSNQPYAVAVDSNGNLFIADTYNSCIRRVDAAGIITTVVGACRASGFSGDGGPATSARLDHPHGVAVDAAGRLTIADTGNYRIRQVSTDGIITTLAGKGDAGTIGAGFTGAWYDPTQSGHGIFLEVLPDNRVLAWWFGFDPAGTKQAWFGGIGTYAGTTATISIVEQTTGGRFVPNFDPSRIQHQRWGSFTFSFSDCHHGKVDFNSVLGYGTGSMNLTRLTVPAGLICP